MNKSAYCIIRETGTSSLELDKIISKDSAFSYYYVRDVLKGRFLLGEEMMSKNEYYSCCYAVNILKGRFRLAEERMVKHVYYEYLVKVMGYNHE